jgi:hypothetical protein
MKGNFGHPSAYEGKPVEKYIEIFAELAEQLPKGLSVTDLFGGVGTLCERLWPILEPKSWFAVEIDPECVLKWKVRKAVVINDDAFKVKDFGDLVVIDPHKGTLNAMVKENIWRGLLYNISLSKAKYILMQEYGAYWCHLPNHKVLYEELFGSVDRYNYRQVFSQYMQDTYGFRTLDSRIGLGSSYYLMEVGK